MRTIKILLAALSVSAVAACTTFTEQDRSQLTAANQNAEAAKQQATQANQTAQQALQAAQQAQAEARSANEKADRMFQRTLRK